MFFCKGLSSGGMGLVGVRLKIYGPQFQTNNWARCGISFLAQNKDATLQYSQTRPHDTCCAETLGLIFPRIVCYLGMDLKWGSVISEFCKRQVTCREHNSCIYNKCRSIHKYRQHRLFFKSDYYCFHAKSTSSRGI